MSMSISRSRRGAAASLLVIAALLVTALPAAAATGTVTVTGGSTAKIVLTIPDDTADFGTELTPDGVGPTLPLDIGFYEDLVNDFGGCYFWNGIARVRSNVIYDLLVTSNEDIDQLRFLTAAPTSYATCAGGEAASGAMFPAPPDPAGGWALNLTRTGRRDTAFSLGLRVLWDDDPFEIPVDTTLTITAQAS